MIPKRIVGRFWGHVNDESHVLDIVLCCYPKQVEQLWQKDSTGSEQRRNQVHPDTTFGTLHGTLRILIIKM